MRLASTTCLLGLVGVSLAIGTASDAGAVRWPGIQPMRIKAEFDRPDHAGLDVDIYGTDGKPKYGLHCHGYMVGDTPGRVEVYKEDGHGVATSPKSTGMGRGFDYSGDFECRLVSLYSAETLPTLFAYDHHQAADWETRARFFARHLVGPCADNPYWGRRRTFRLRGMRITIGISNERFKTVRLSDGMKMLTFASYEVEIDVERDPSATTDIAAPDGMPVPDWFYRPSRCLAGTKWENGLRG